MRVHKVTVNEKRGCEEIPKGEKSVSTLMKFMNFNSKENSLSSMKDKVLLPPDNYDHSTIGCKRITPMNRESRVVEDEKKVKKEENKNKVKDFDRD